MLRTGASRSLVRSFNSPSSAPLIRATHNAAFSKPQTSLATATRVLAASHKQSPTSLALIKFKPFTTSLQRSSTTATDTVYSKINHEAEMKIANQIIRPADEDVTLESSVTDILDGDGKNPVQPDDTDMLAGVKNDIATIKETFSLKDVPKEALTIGLAGVLPYLATSLSTVYLAWDINVAHATGSGFLVSGQTAEALLHILEPIQVGYGAVIISFLGAIHWGLEFAKYGGRNLGYRRYAIGVVAPAVAWPTMLLPVEYALTAQFLAFVFLYYADARATVRGWAPAWYATYRFVLTFIVGASLVVSLIGRGEIVDKLGKLPGPADKLKALRDSQWESLAKEEEERRAKVEAADEEDEADGGAEAGGEDEDEE